MEDNLFQIQGSALSNKGSGNIIAMKGELHQLHQVSDMVQVRRSKPKLMVTGSDNPVTQGATVKAWLTFNIRLKKESPGFILHFIREV